MFDNERKAEQHRILLDLASHFGYIVISPTELVEMVNVAAAKRPVRVAEVDSVIHMFEQLLERVQQDSDIHFQKTVSTVLKMYLSDLKLEVAKRGA